MVEGGAEPGRGASPRLAAIVAGAHDPDGSSADSPDPIDRPGGSAGTAPALGRGTWWWRIGFVVMLGAAIVAIPVLALMGKEAVEDSTRGALIGVISDPSAPGFEVLVEPSPTMLLIQSEGEELESVTFLALSSESTGSALFLSPLTGVETPDGAVTLRDAWANGGEQELVDTVEHLLGVGIAEFASDGTLLTTTPDDVPVVLVDRAQWTRLVEPVAPITVENPYTVEVLGADGTVQVRFEAGPLQLAADEVGSYLAARGAGESDLNRMERHQRFWEGWIAAVADAGGREAVAGERETGLGLYVTTFSEGEAGFVPANARSVRIPGATDDTYAVAEDWLTALIADMVPFPTSPQPGVRPTVRVLDGTGTPEAAITVARELARSGVEIRAIGNGPAFDQTVTRILYHDAEQQEVAEQVRDMLGAGEIDIAENLDEVVAVTVILGPDVVDGLDLP
jgi:hypothetical protein